MSQKYRLVTRSDLDGIVCASLLKEAGMIEEIKFAHPKDMQDGTVEITNNDIITNLPYHPKAHMVFDHHASEMIRNTQPAANMVNDPTAPSAAAGAGSALPRDQSDSAETVSVTMPEPSFEKLMASVDSAIP